MNKHITTKHPAPNKNTDTAQDKAAKTDSLSSESFKLTREEHHASIKRDDELNAKIRGQIWTYLRESTRCDTFPGIVAPVEKRELPLKLVHEWIKTGFFLDIRAREALNSGYPELKAENDTLSAERQALNPHRSSLFDNLLRGVLKK